MARARNQYDEAERLARRSLSIIEKRWGPQDPYAAYALQELAEALIARGELKEVEPMLLPSPKRFSKRMRGRNTRTSLATTRIRASYHLEKREYAKARELAQRTLQAFEKTSGAAFGKTWDVLGQAEEGLKNFERAEELLRRGAAVREKLLGEDHPDVFESLDHLAKVEGELGKQAEADALAKRAMGLREAGGGTASGVETPQSREAHPRNR